MSLGRHLFAVAGVTGLAAAIVAGGGRLAGSDAGKGAVAVEAFEMEDALPQEPDLAPEVVSPGRAVAPGIVSPVTPADEPLERVEPRASLSELARPPKPGTPEPTLLYRPVATAAGRIEAHGHLIELPGIEVVDPDRVCETSSGATWPCGMMARTAFRRYIRGCAIECTVSETPAPEPVATACRLGDEDIAAWLVRHGWAEPVGGAYDEEAQAARSEKLGLHGDGPSTAP